MIFSHEECLLLFRHWFRNRVPFHLATRGIAADAALIRTALLWVMAGSPSPDVRRCVGEKWPAPAEYSRAASGIEYRFPLQKAFAAVPCRSHICFAWRLLNNLDRSNNNLGSNSARRQGHKPRKPAGKSASAGRLWDRAGATTPRWLPAGPGRQPRCVAPGCVQGRRRLLRPTSQPGRAGGLASALAGSDPFGLWGPIQMTY